MTTIQDIYKLIDEYSLLKMHFYLASDLRRSENEIESCDKEKLISEIIIAEIDFDEKGKIHDYNEKLVESLKMQHFNFVDRYSTTKNISYRAKYSLFDWRINKNFDSLKIAIDSYIDFCKYLILNYDKNYEHKDLMISENISIVLNLTKETSNTKYKQDIVIDIIKKVINDEKYNQSDLITLDLIELIFDNDKLFKSIQYKYLQELCYKHMTNKSISENFITSFYKIATKMDRKLKKSFYDWNLVMAEYYECLSENTNDFTVLEYLIKAIQYYRNSNIGHKILKLEKKLSDIRTNEFLTNYFDIKVTSEQINNLKKAARNVIDKCSNEYSIIKYICEDNNIIPKVNIVNNEENSIAEFLCSSITIDDNGNIRHVGNSDEKIREYQFARNFNISIIYYEIYFVEFIEYAIRQKKLSFEMIIDYLNNTSWISCNVIKKISNNEKIQYNWLEELYVVIKMFFDEMYYSFKNEDYRRTFRIFIDLVTPKFEGLLRDIFEVNRIPIIRFKPNYNTEEHDINSYLQDERLNNFLTVEEIYFLSWLLVRTKNLRNKVAHCMMLPSDYNEINAIWLFYALLRICKIKINENVIKQ